MSYIPTVLRTKIRRKFKDACANCRSPEHLMGVIFEIDHIIPLVEGGKLKRKIFVRVVPRVIVIKLLM